MAGTIPADENEFPKVLLAEGAAAATPGTGLVVVYAKSDGLLYWKDDAGTEYSMDVAAHLANATDAHDASAVSVLDTAAVFTGVNVETVLKELYDAIAGGGISPTIFGAKGDVLGASANDTPAITSVGADGTALRAASGQSTGLEFTWKHSLKDYASILYTTGDITCDADQVWEDLAGVGDLTLSAATGDTIEVGFSVMAANSTAVAIAFDCGTIVSAAVVNHISYGGAPDNARLGPGAWRISSGSSHGVGGSILYTLQAGDITSDTVVLRMRDRPESNTNRDISASTARPLHFWAKNLGPAI